MSDIFGTNTTTTSSSSSNADSSTNNYASDESAALFNNLYSTLTSALGSSTETNPYTEAAASNLSDLAGNSTLSSMANGDNLDVTNNSIYTDAADAITDNAMDTWTSAANQINDTFNNTSFWSGSAHENALASEADTVASDLSDSLSGYWLDALQNEENNTLSAYNDLGNTNSTLATTGSSLYDQGTSEYNTLLSYLNSLVQSANDTSTTSSSSANSTEEQQTSGLGNALGTVAAALISKSDRRIKSNIAAITNALAIVKKLNPVTFFKHNFAVDPAAQKVVLSDSGKETAGFIAQEVAAVIPSAVNVPPQDWQLYSLNENEIIPYLCAAIQELARKVEQLETKERDR